MSKTTLTPRLDAQFAEAFALAHQLHLHQVRKGSTIPYISHLMAVASLVLEDGGTQTETIAALLHDAVEDQGGAETLAIIRHQFGEEVAYIVDMLSDAKVQPKPPWKERKQAILERLRTAPASVLRVAIADKLHNASAQLRHYRVEGEFFWERFNASQTEILFHLQLFIQLCQSRQNESQNLKELESVYEALMEN